MRGSARVIGELARRYFSAYQVPDHNISGPTKELYKTSGTEEGKGYPDSLT